jgi:hypothetical protein
MNQEKAKALFNEAMEFLQKGNEGVGIPMMKDLAEQDFAPAINLLVCFYESQQEPDLEVIFKQYEKLGKLGDVSAKVKVGVSYCRGEGVSRNPFVGLTQILEALKQNVNGINYTAWSGIGDVFRSGWSTESGNWFDHRFLERKISIECYEREIRWLENSEEKHPHHNELVGAIKDIIRSLQGQITDPAAVKEYGAVVNNANFELAKIHKEIAELLGVT